VFKHVADACSYSILSRVCSEWYQLLLEESIWRPLFLRFPIIILYKSNHKTEILANGLGASEVAIRTTSEVQSIVKKLLIGDNNIKTILFEVKILRKSKLNHGLGWQFDINNKHNNIDICNDDFTVSLTTGDGYNGVR
jgi:hypothetical protein